MAECRASGVPVPDTILGVDWVNHGTFEGEFVSSEYFPELWSWESTSPRGLCLALPRYTAASGGRARFFGLICLGVETSRACFFDNPRDTMFARGPVALDRLVGGADLVPNRQGICTDCHTGENPFVVHPEIPAFASLLGMRSAAVRFSNAWYDPLVDASWPMNPGPIESLGSPGAGERQCTDCHSRGASGGRLPLPSADLTPSYCVVLGVALARTMPPSFSRGNYASHSARLLQYCQTRSTGVVVPSSGPEDDSSVLSPPQILEPLYLCGGVIGVTGARVGAEVVLRRDGVPVAMKVARAETVEFSLSEVVPGGMAGRWTAVQRVGSVTSAASREVRARDVMVDYPSGLPLPSIDPLLTHACAQSVAVTHVPGLTIEVERSRAGVTRVRASTGGSRGRTAVAADAPFATQDRVRVRQWCGGRSSAWSVATTPRVEPTPLPQPQIDENEVFVGQSIVTVSGSTEGARIELGPFTGGSWPITSQTVGIGDALRRPLISTDALPLRQRLCGASSEVVVRPRECTELPAPEAATPLGGTDVIRLTDYVPGSTVRVWSGTAEIGDGSGGEIRLVRSLISGETLRVMQELPGCRASEHFQVVVR